MFANWGNCWWNYQDHCLESESYQSKTGIIESIPHTRHKDQWTLCVVTALALMLIVDPDSEDTTPDAQGRKREPENKFIFPCLRTVQKKCMSSMINKWIKAVCDLVLGLSALAKTHDLRYGAMIDMMRHMDLPALDAIFRGGWHFAGDTQGLHYADRRSGLIRAMRALNDYRNLFQDVPVPSMENIDLKLNEFQNILFKNFEKTLFA